LTEILREDGLDIIVQADTKQVARNGDSKIKLTVMTPGGEQSIVDADTDQLLGAAILGIEGGEVMAVFEMAMIGKVHGMENLYIGDGSVLPRASRVNPALTIYAWGLRLGRHLGQAN
jgi:choline dehydrogenase-like flavoprotein